MSTNLKSVLRNTLVAIGISAIIFCIVGVAMDLGCKGNFSTSNYFFTKMALGSLLIGLGFGLPTFLYENDRLPLFLQSVLHMGIGCAVMLTSAFAVGWIPISSGLYALIFPLLGELAIALLIWLGFYLHNRKLVKTMNEQISKRTKTEL